MTVTLGKSARVSARMGSRHLVGPLGKLDGQRPDTGADLQNSGPGSDAGGVGNIPGHPVFNEEVLPQRFGEVETVPVQESPDLIDVAKIHGKSPNKCLFCISIP